MHRFLIALSVLALVACVHPKETPEVKVSTPLSGPGKPTAPVEIAAELTPTHARLTVRFEAGAEQATFTFSGLDGLTVTSSPPGSERNFKQAESVQLDVDYTGAAGTLVVNVSGTFNGAKKSRVVTFAVGEVKPSTSGTKVAPDNGPAFKSLPAGN